MGHNIIFNGINSADYGILISGAGTYATPERDIQSIPVPGRNGDIQIDNGRYNNIQVRFEAGLSRNFEPNYLPFLRELLSAPLYSRLEDSYHPDEFRLATFRSEMVPDVGTIMRSGKFELVFDCMPQRFLKSGEIALPQMSTSYLPSAFVADGIGTDIFCTDVITGDPDFGTDDSWTVLDLSGLGTYYDLCVKVWYSEDAIGQYYAFGNFGSDPTQTYTTLIKENVFMRTNYYQYGKGVIFDRLVDPYVAFITPLRWEIYNLNTDTVVQTSFDSPEIVRNPTLFPSNPLIHMTVSSSLSGELVALVNDFPIRLSTPNSLPDIGQTLTDIYIDCETMDAYTAFNEAVYSLNKYVTLPDKTIILNPGENNVYINGYIDSLEIVPRWFTI